MAERGGRGTWSAELSFDALLAAAHDFIDGAWLMVKSFGKMSLFSIILVIEGLRWLWNEGIGKKRGGGER